MTTPPFNPQVPLATDFIADSQQEFLTNFKTISTAFANNHISLESFSNNGNHTFISLLEQAVPRSTESQEIALYTKKVKGQTTQLFMRYPLDGKEFQLNEYQLYRPPHIGNIQAAFFSVLPGGIIVYFGSIFPTGNSFPITLNPAICKNIMGINLCPITPSSSNLATNFQSNVSLRQKKGVYDAVILNTQPLGTGPSNPPPQYYLIFGNIL